MEGSNFHKLSVDESKMNECMALMDSFPYNTVISLKPMIDFWQNENVQGNASRVIAKEIKKRLTKEPRLAEPITDLSFVEEHLDTIQLIMSAALPMFEGEDAFFAISKPFSKDFLYASPKFLALRNKFEDVFTVEETKLMELKKFISANLIILHEYYGIEKQEESPYRFQVFEPETGLEKHFQINIDATFVDLVAKKKPKRLKKAEIFELLNELGDVDLWKQKIDIDNFEFHGLVKYDVIDVTEPEVISRLKDELLEKDAITTMEHVKKLDAKLQSIFNTPDIHMGIIASKTKEDVENPVGNKICNSLFIEDGMDLTFLNEEGSLIYQLMQSGRPVLSNDVKEFKNPTKYEKLILERGYRNVIISPLYQDDKPIGILELASKNPGDLTALSMMKLSEILPLFSIAAKRSIDELQNQVQAIIKEKYTAIHPTVEWRFVQSALKHLQNQKKGAIQDLDPISFKNVFPLYGQSDIKSSSDARSHSIQMDLIKQLKLVKKVLNKTLEGKQFPIYDELRFQVEELIKKIRLGLKSGDELLVQEFFTSKIDPLFEHLSKTDANLAAEIDRFKAELDPDHGLIYDKRKDYEESVNRINDMVGSYIDEQQAIAQSQFPHYFEKYKTDGVEYTIYTGESLMQDDHFGPLYLQNLRLWQLLLMCEIARKTNEIVPTLKVPLETTHLILVYSAPLTIGFKSDEKQFDVEGIYNMRYEIVKKRIDKALVKGTNERITQPGKIAIIFSQQREKLEYLKYVEYLKSLDLIEDKVEELDVENLQSVEGLKALRLTVSNQSDSKQKKSSLDILERIQQEAL